MTQDIDIPLDTPAHLTVFESRRGDAVVWFGKVDNFNPSPGPVPPGGAVEVVGPPIRVASNDAGSMGDASSFSGAQEASTK